MKEFITAVPANTTKGNYKCSFCTKSFKTADERNKCEQSHENELKKEEAYQKEAHTKYIKAVNACEEAQKSVKEYFDFVSKNDSISAVLSLPSVKTILEILDI